MKEMLLYHGKQLFAKPIDNPSLLAQTVLSIKILICLNEGPKFLARLSPISKLTPAFLLEQIELTKAIICDGKQVNQAFF